MRVTFAKMIADETLILYKSRDGSETFRADKSYFGVRAEQVYSNN